MREEKLFIASAEVARRANVTGTRYMTTDGRFIISERDIRRLRNSMTPEEYAHGLDVEIISKSEAKELIKQGGYKLGKSVKDNSTQVPEETTVDETIIPSEESEEPKEETQEESQETTESSEETTEEVEEESDTTEAEEEESKDTNDNEKEEEE